MIVADTNLIAYLLIEGDQTEIARECFARDSKWIAPAVWRHEFVNVLSLNVRKEELSRAKALELLVLADELITSPPVWPDVERVIDWAVEHKFASYDAEFLITAETNGVRVVTADKKFLAEAGRLAVSISDFAIGR